MSLWVLLLTQVATRAPLVEPLPRRRDLWGHARGAGFAPACTEGKSTRRSSFRSVGRQPYRSAGTVNTLQSWASTFLLLAPSGGRSRRPGALADDRSAFAQVLAGRSHACQLGKLRDFSGFDARSCVIGGQKSGEKTTGETVQACAEHSHTEATPCLIANWTNSAFVRRPRSLIMRYL